MTALLTRLPLSLWLRIGTVALALAAFGLLYWRYTERGETIDVLRAEIAAFEEVSRIQARQLEKAAAQLRERASERATATETLKQEIRRAPTARDRLDADDRAVLERLRRQGY